MLVFYYFWLVGAIYGFTNVNRLLNVCAREQLHVSVRASKCIISVTGSRAPVPRARPLARSLCRSPSRALVRLPVALSPFRPRLSARPCVLPPRWSLLRLAFSSFRSVALSSASLSLLLSPLAGGCVCICMFIYTHLLQEDLEARSRSSGTAWFESLHQRGPWVAY